jgi:dTDP-4-amino-4,6-dideoxygalactose transaminase
MERINISKPLIGEEEINSVVDVLKSGIIVQNKKVVEFEYFFSKFNNVNHSIATNNGTTALHTALIANEINGGEVLVPSFSFIASANSVLMSGAKPVFVDINKDDFCIDLEDAEKKITKKTKAIMPVHMYGQPCNMKKITEFAENNNLKIIEDACQAHGAEFENKKVGSFGTGCFSFYATKNMTTGEGGMITTNDDFVYEKCKLLRNHGMKERYNNIQMGYNYKMTDIQAAIGIEQIKKLEEFNKRRIKNANYFLKNINKTGIILPKVYKNRKHVFHQFTIRITKNFHLTREEFIEKLNKENIYPAIYYKIPIHKQKFYKYNSLCLPKTESLSKEVVSIPVHPDLSEEELKYIVEKINGV